MTLVLGGIGWGLLALGALTHLWHHDRLRHLLGLHLDAPKPAAATLVAWESLLAVTLAVATLTNAAWLAVPALAAVVTGLAFGAWIAQLLRSDSGLPCACSFSAGPTTPWSLVRALGIGLAGVVGLASLDGLATLDRAIALLVGATVAGGLFVLPEALSWPRAAKGQLARIDSHQPASSSV